MEPAGVGWAVTTKMEVTHAQESSNVPEPSILRDATYFMHLKRKRFVLFLSRR